MYPYSSSIHRRRTVRTLCLLLFLGGFFLFRGSYRPAIGIARDIQLARGMERIPGHLVPQLTHARAIGATNFKQQLHLSVVLKQRDPLALDALLTAQSDPASPLYHHYLSPQDFNSRFSPTQASIHEVVDYMHSQGFPILAVSPNRLIVSMAGTVAMAQQAFKISFNNYQLKDRIVFAPTIDPALPSNLLSTIQLIGGLNNVSLYHPLHTLHPLSTHKQRYRRLGPAGGFTPDELRSAYDVQPLLNAGNNGSGQTIGLFELDGYNPTDINTYLTQFKLGPPKYTTVSVDGTSDQPGKNAEEVELDMEMLSAMAPGAQQKVYIGQNTLVGASDIFNRIVTDDAVKIVTISWGECEAQTVPDRLDALDAIIKQGTAQGQTFFAASGDAGAYDCNDSNPAVDSIASDPYTIGVGGTSLYLGPANSYGHETAWESGEATDGSGSGGGGGTSMHFLRHSFQHGLNLTSPYRMVPDVSAVADPLTGYAVFSTNAGSSGWLDVGGTSAAAPLWAGMAADLNQYLLQQHPPLQLGNTIVTLYQLYNTPQLYPPYHDITTGNNLFYAATKGYDLATGMGSPDLWNIARDIVRLPVSGSVLANTITKQVLQNTGFEDGSTSWQEQSKGGSELVDPTNPHSGVNSAYFCGYIGCDDSISQTVILPATFQAITVSYWVYLGPAKADATCPDNFTASLQTGRGGLIETLQKLCTTNKTQDWTIYTFDVTKALAHYANQAIRVTFTAVKADRQRSNYFLDDVQLNETLDCTLALNCASSTQ